MAVYGDNSSGFWGLLFQFRGVGHVRNVKLCLHTILCWAGLTMAWLAGYVAGMLAGEIGGTYYCSNWFLLLQCVRGCLTSIHGLVRMLGRTGDIHIGALQRLLTAIVECRGMVFV